MDMKPAKHSLEKLAKEYGENTFGKRWIDNAIADIEVLEAENAKLREALEKLLMVIGNFTGNEILCDTVTEKQIVAAARALVED